MLGFAEVEDELIVVECDRVGGSFTMDLLEVALALDDGADQHCRCLNDLLLLLLDLGAE